MSTFYFINNTNGTRWGSCGPPRRSPVPGTYPYYTALYIYPLLFLLGTIGNILILAILRKMKQKSKGFLAAMALSDFCFFIPMFMATLPAYDSLALNENFVKFWYHSNIPINAVANWFSSASICFVVCIAIERLAAIRSPLKSQPFRKKRFLIFIIVLIFAISGIIQAPRLFGYYVLKSKYENETVYCIGITRKYHFNAIMLLITRTALPLITVVIPMIFLTFLNGFLVYFVHRSRKNVALFGSRNQVAADNEAKLTKLVLVILTTFFVLNFPSAIVELLVATERDLHRLRIIQNLPAHTTNIMVTLNKVLNFFIYFCSSSQFRKKLKVLWKKLCKRQNSLWLYVSSSKKTGDSRNSRMRECPMYYENVNSKSIGDKEVFL